MIFKDIAVLKEDFSIARGMDVKIDGAIISSIRESAPGTPEKREAPGTPETFAMPKTPEKGERVIDGRGKLLTPAFYNTHTHLAMTLMRGYGENLKLKKWLDEKILPFEDKLTGEDCFWGALLAMAESFSHGIVSSSDHYYHCEDIVRAAVNAGAKLNIARGLSFFDELLDLTGFQPYQESSKLYKDHHGTNDDRIRVDIGLHSEYTATPALIEAVAGLSKDTGAPVHVHVSETRSEHEECKGRNGGRTPTRVFADSGAFDNGGIAAHCVWVEEEDADIMKEKGVTAVSCPVSNMKLASGIARIPLLLDKGVNVALGTDGAASNNNLNFFEEVKLLALSSKVRLDDPTLITPAEALYAATRAGAFAQGRTDCGFVKEGYRADLLVLDLGSPSLNPIYDAATALVFSASSRDILMTIADGRVVYDRGSFPTIDLEKTIFEVGRVRDRIVGELGKGL